MLHLLILKPVMHSISALVQNVVTQVSRLLSWISKVFVSIKEVGE
ncbi:hypothetical protein MIZ03_2674 [Rhodoferax lithotrophicus]|uniref:Uncharacterized protein n=1 Tax=Rhodoferax lithotrophicus TaxID=2798804 RepID=A0ABN6D7U8_9BURK|nr:hypothetical protein MIZ03_2674 [Rhodoferax sp. MIZ03]